MRRTYGNPSALHWLLLHFIQLLLPVGFFFSVFLFNVAGNNVFKAGISAQYQPLVLFNSSVQSTFEIILVELFRSGLTTYGQLANLPKRRN